MNYGLAWVVIAGAGLLGSGFLFYLTRSIGAPSFRWVLRVLPPLLMLVPAPVPNYDGQLAPAFVVLIFEGLFQAEGQPVVAGVILVITLIVGIALGLLLGRALGSQVSETVEQTPG